MLMQRKEEGMEKAIGVFPIFVSCHPLAAQLQQLACISGNLQKFLKS